MALIVHEGQMMDRLSPKKRGRIQADVSMRDNDVDAPSSRYSMQFIELPEEGGWEFVAPTRGEGSGGQSPYRLLRHHKLRPPKRVEKRHSFDRP